jgi:hypothetical protein
MRAEACLPPKVLPMMRMASPMRAIVQSCGVRKHERVDDGGRDTIEGTLKGAIMRAMRGCTKT